MIRSLSTLPTTPVTDTPRDEESRQAICHGLARRMRRFSAVCSSKISRNAPKRGERFSAALVAILTDLDDIADELASAATEDQAGRTLSTCYTAITVVVSLLHTLASRRSEFSLDTLIELKDTAEELNLLVLNTRQIFLVDADVRLVDLVTELLASDLDFEKGEEISGDGG